MGLNKTTEIQYFSAWFLLNFLLHYLGKAITFPLLTSTNSLFLKISMHTLQLLRVCMHWVSDRICKIRNEWYCSDLHRTHSITFLPWSSAFVVGCRMFILLNPLFFALNMILKDPFFVTCNYILERLVLSLPRKKSSEYGY